MRTSDDLIFFAQSGPRRVSLPSAHPCYACAPAFLAVNPVSEDESAAKRLCAPSSTPGFPGNHRLAPGRRPLPFTKPTPTRAPRTQKV
ncbi:unnamed protein product [Pieris macdunnoughi]|uniref:Uncharacterized protein n=1 Tax=Pieris macdunnoughi TaxID=345717 RepID=A0A821UGR9_9NEOP|nr:unnamed protein product [Pieris macdunnoughi]